MTRRTCTEPNCTRRPERGTNTELCEQHNWEAMLENDHMDGNHDYHDECPVCRDETPDETPAPAPRPEPTRTNTSHADCDHPKTKSARAACRRARNSSSAPPAPARSRNVVKDFFGSDLTNWHPQVFPLDRARAAADAGVCIDPANHTNYCPCGFRTPSPEVPDIVGYLNDDNDRCLDCNHIHPDMRCPACGCGYFGDHAATLAPGDYRPSKGPRRTR